MTGIRIAAVVAMAENNCIGKDNDLPWHIPEDLKRFKSLTIGKPVIMGRKTFESIVARLGRPLPGRDNIVISRSGFLADGAISCHTLDDALTKAKEIAITKSLDEIIIGGGAQLYSLALPQTDRIYLTRVHMVVNGDAFFPEWPTSEWHETGREDRPGDPSYSYITLDRRP